MKKILFISLLMLLGSSAQALSAALPEQIFIYAFDKNGDHKLNLKEFLTAQKSLEKGLNSYQKPLIDGLDWDFPIQKSSFQKLDRNKDGFLDYHDELPIRYKLVTDDDIQCSPSCNEDK